MRPKNKSRDLQEMNAIFQTALVSFDEGLLGSDKDLACAVWRSLIRHEIEEKLQTDDEEVENSSINAGLAKIVDAKADPRSLEAIVCYIRKQVGAFV